MKTYALSLSAFFMAAVLSAADAVEVSNGNNALKFDRDGVMILDAQRKPMLKFQRIRFVWSPPEAVPVSAEKTGPETLKVNYRIVKDHDGKIKVSSLFSLTDGGIRIKYKVSAPKEVRTGGVMQIMVPQKGIAKGAVYKSGIWTRAKNGGVPYEEKDRYLKPFRGPEQTLWLEIPGNHTWCTETTEHLPLKKEKEGEWESEYVFRSVPSSLNACESAAVFGGRPLALQITSDRVFHIWESGTPELKLEVTNTSGKVLKAVPLTVFAFDYDGKKVLDLKDRLDLAPGERRSAVLKLPGEKRNLYFLEASVSVGGREFFTRTNAALLPPHEYRHPEKSNIGIAAFFDQPDRTSVLKLMKRIGVHYYRQGDNRETAKYGIVSFAHNNVSATVPFRPEKDGKRVEKMVADFQKRRNPVWEFGNEWNFNKPMKEKQRRAAVYVTWAKALKEEIAKRGYEVRLVSVGLAGGDIGFVRALQEAGAWPLIDGVALHPGRGNSTPDAVGNGWFYRGAIQRVKKQIAEFGEKPLHLTEVYACTQPNNWWVDSYRQGAENVLLTFALGVAEKAASVLFYQMHNGVWADVNGINPKDREYDYGLLMRDNSPKPSLMGFAAAAEHLDGAEFIRNIEIPGTKIRGMEYSTPRGKMAIVYDRTDGTQQSKNTKDFVHREAWVDHWKTHRAHDFKSNLKEVRTVDAIGRETKIPVREGIVSLTLSGAPLIVYGLELD